jgi:hypothetical protein
MVKSEFRNSGQIQNSGIRLREDSIGIAENTGMIPICGAQPRLQAVTGTLLILGPERLLAAK